MTAEHITSRQNPLLAKVRRLQRGRGVRLAEGEYLADGRKLLEEALEHGAELTAVILAEGVPQPELAGGVRCAVVPRDVMASISPMDTPQGALFLAKRPDTRPPETLKGSRYLVLDGVQDPGNVGTIWRTADALGADGLLLVNRCADPFSPKTVRATMGACFRLPVYEVEGEGLLPLLERSRLPLYATALRPDAVELGQVELGRCAVVIGSEGRGVSPELLAASGRAIRIPMSPRCESLNAAVAASIVLWEMGRDRG